MTRDLSEEAISAAREGRRKKQPGQDPEGLDICIMFWNGGDCANLLKVKEGSLYRAQQPSKASFIDATRLKQILELDYDAGFLFGPARA